MEEYSIKQQDARVPISRRPSPVRPPRRTTLLLLRSCALTALLLVAVLSTAFRVDYIHNQCTKQIPTDFAQFHKSTGLSAAEPPERPARRTNGTHIDDRYVLLRELGSGQEGSAAAYLDVLTEETVVVKTFYGGNPRNEIPAELQPYFVPFTSTWPAAVEAGLLLNTKMPVDSVNLPRYMPVKDFFVLEDLSNSHMESRWSWAIVTPLASEGTLVTLTSGLRQYGYTPLQVDIAYRSQLNALLASLDELHGMGYCHDDIKPDNIFIDSRSKVAANGSDKVWMLGDVGSLRQVDHPWHKTYNWRRQGQWPDCRINDVRRLLKSYFAFMRAACEDQRTFDLTFINQEQNWAKLNSEFMSVVGPDIRQGSSSAARTLALSQSLSPEDPSDTAAEQRPMQYARWMSKSVTKDLTCTTKSRWMDWGDHK